ncbi:hypothetical protein B0J14DRAFT_586053 [Halenospora varia]|nr:hypothetical protein B0J14DRAFT_586053 [Halenospora varia]
MPPSSRHFGFLIFLLRSDTRFIGFYYANLNLLTLSSLTSGDILNTIRCGNLRLSHKSCEHVDQSTAKRVV